MFFPWYAMPYAVVIITFGILFIEGKSVIENSRKKKSSAGEIMEMVSQIIKCATEKDASRLIEEIKERTNSPLNKKDHE